MKSNLLWKIFIQNMGIRSYIDPVPALALGSSESNVYELVSAFSTFANQGVHTAPIFVTLLEDRQGNMIASFIPQSQDAVSERTAYTMLTMLQDVVNSGTAGRLRWQFGLTDMEIGGKTGTAENPHGQDHGLFIAYAPVDNPKLVVAAVVEQGSYGSTAAGPIVYKVLEKMLQEKD